MPRLKKKKVSSKYQVITANGTGEAPLPKLKLNLRLFHGEEIAFGPGKADLLEAIARTGSISSAGREMEMSYRRAWVLVDEMNRCFKYPLVETMKGGFHGGGARLTPFGEDVLNRYREMISATRHVAMAYLGLFKDMMSDAPTATTRNPTEAPPPPDDTAAEEDDESTDRAGASH
jgi:molybdate transport system regulatory protein